MPLPHDVQSAHIQAELALRGHSSRSTWVIVGATSAALAGAIAAATSLKEAAMISAYQAWIIIVVVPLLAGFGAAMVRYVMKLQDRAEALDGVLKRHREYDALIYQIESTRLQMENELSKLRGEAESLKMSQVMILSQLEVRSGREQ